MTAHKQTWVKVNAPVDEGIAPLIEALSQFPGVRTLDSCEGKKDEAWVCFDCGEEDWTDLSEFVLSVIGPPLMAEFGDRVELKVGIAESGLYRAEMTVAKSVLPAVSKAVKSLSRTAKAA
jgi:hypothetical protein